MLDARCRVDGYGEDEDEEDDPLHGWDSTVIYISE